MGTLFETGVRPAIDDWLLAKSKEVRSYGEYWSASSAGYCMRKVIFERLGVPKIEQESDARKQRVFTSGHLFHDWIQGITKKTKLSIAQELELQDEDLMIRGHIDDLVLVMTPSKGLTGDMGESDSNHQRLILYDYKTVNSRAFLWAKKNGNVMSYYHKMQLGTYMYMLKKHPIFDNGVEQPKNLYGKSMVKGGQTYDLTEARILKIEKDTLMMMEQQLMWDAELESDVLSYWKTLNEYWESKKLPKCTCKDHEGGFLAKEEYNGYFYEGEPCSLEWYKLKKAEGVLK